MLRARGIVAITEDIREYAAGPGVTETATVAKGMEDKSRDSSRPGGEREDVCAANGRRPSLRELTSQFVEKGAEVYAKA